MMMDDDLNDNMLMLFETLPPHWENPSQAGDPSQR